MLPGTNRFQCFLIYQSAMQRHHSASRQKNIPLSKIETQRADLPLDEFLFDFIKLKTVLYLKRVTSNWAVNVF